MTCKKYLFCLLILFFSVPSCTAETVTKGSSSPAGEIELAIYGNDLCLVREVRSVNVPSGAGELKFDGIPESIIPETVNVRSLSDPEGFTVLEQTYDHDLVNADNILAQYVGKAVKIIDFNEYQDRKDVVEATLLSDSGGKVFRIADEIYLGHPGYVVLPEVPANFTVKPALIWAYENRNSGAQKLQVSYLAGNVTWKADYTLILDAGDSLADISCWATLNNSSGTAYDNARVKLIAGSVRRESSAVMMKARYSMDTASAMMSAPSASENAFFEYHVYDIPRRVTVEENKPVQVKLFSSGKVKVTKEFSAETYGGYFTGPSGPEEMPVPVAVSLKFKNDEASRMGMPLPGGVMRVYKEDSSSGLGFIGEDRMKDTARNGEVEIKLGNAFDVTVVRKQTDYKQLSKNLYETAWEVTLRNGKDEAVSVNVIEGMQGNWTVVESTIPYKKTGAYRIKFEALVPAGKETKVAYRVRTGI